MGKVSSAARRIQDRRKQVISLFHGNGNLSKNDIFKMTRYSFSTVISTVDDMCADGLLQSVESPQSSVGRPAVYYSLYPDYGYVLGIDINASHVNIALCNFHRQVIRTSANPIPKEKQSLPAIIAWIPELIDGMLSEFRPSPRILCIGVAGPGLVDQNSGRILRYSRFPQDKNVEVSSLLESRYGCPVYMDKSLNCLAVAYKESSPHKLDNMLLISMRTGVGMSSILDGKIYHGANGLAGEIGSMRIPGITGGMNHLGAGTLDSELSIDSIAQKLDAVFGESLGENGLPMTPAQKVSRFAELVKENQPDCIRILDEVCYNLGHCVSQLIHLLDPSDVLFYGEITQCGEVFLAHLRSYLTAQSHNPQLPRIAIADLSRFAFAEGAAYFAFERYLMPSTLMAF